MSATAIRAEGGFESAMKAVILYDAPALAAQAKAMLERASYQADQAVQWELKLWRFDMLKLSQTADEALAEVADAHLIVFAQRQAQPLPAGLMDWLDKWATGRQVQGAALAAFHLENGDTLSGTAATELARFSERHGLNLILGDVSPTEDASAAIARSLPGRDVLLGPALDKIMRQPERGFNQWGINE